MKDRLLATRYARALLSTLPDAASAERADAFLSALSGAIASSPDLRDVVLNPAVSRADRRALLLAIAEGQGAPREVRNFLGVLADHGRAGALPMISEVFRTLKEEAGGVVSATITTAVALEPAVADRARAALEKLTGKSVRLALEVEPGIVGGAVARVGSTIWDGSVKSQLAALRRRMAEE